MFGTLVGKRKMSYKRQIQKRDTQGLRFEQAIQLIARLQVGYTDHDLQHIMKIFVEQIFNPSHA